MKTIINETIAKQLTSQDLRWKLPGNRIEVVLVSESIVTKPKKQIILVINIFGYLETVGVSNPGFWLMVDDNCVASFATLEEARLAWDKPAYN